MPTLFLFKIGFLPVSWVDVLDILLVATLFYQLYKLLRGTIALRVSVGFLLLFVIYQLVQATRMQLLASILGQFMGVGAIAVFILFQQEIRRFLSLIGKTSTMSDFPKLLFGGKIKADKAAQLSDIDQILEALKALSAESMGALIVFSVKNPLDYYAETGDLIESRISKRLLVSIFYGKNPLHDGAVIIYKDRIRAARCRLPISDNDAIPAALGMRHRAALGMSESTDALILIASEETGQLSLMQEGKMHLNQSLPQLRKLMKAYVQQEEEKENVNEESL